MTLNSSAVTAGNNAKASEYNGLRNDVIQHTHDGADTALVKHNRAFTWYLDGTSIVADEVGAKYIVPEAMTVTNIRHKLVSGTATIRVQKDTTDVDASISVTSSAGNETSITSASLTAGQVLTLDITSASSPVGLTVTVECLQG